MISDRKQKIVVSICMIVVLCLLTGTATYAWLTNLNNRVAANGIKLDTDGTGELKVEIAIEPNGDRIEMSRVNETNAVIDMGLTRLANIEDNKLGPGAFGEVHIYITSYATSFDSYVIGITPKYTVVGGDVNVVTQLAKEHIKFYSIKNSTGYAGEISYKEVGGAMVGLEGDLAEESETEVILYWYWPYEYEEVPDRSNISATNSREYDLQDTMIGNYIETIGFTFEVEGRMNGS